MLRDDEPWGLRVPFAPPPPMTVIGPVLLSRRATVAATQQREHQRAIAQLLPEGHRPTRLHRRRPCSRRRRTQPTTPQDPWAGAPAVAVRYPSIRVRVATTAGTRQAPLGHSGKRGQAWRTQLRNASLCTPSLFATDTIAPGAPPSSRRTSNTILTARSRNSGGYLWGLAMARIPPPGNRAYADPRAIHGEVRMAWHAKEVVQEIDTHTDPVFAAVFVERLGQLLQDPSCPLEINRVGRTLLRWHTQIVNWH